MKKPLAILIIIIVLFIPAHTIYGENEEPPDINSESAILIDMKSGTILYEKNKDREMYPASITKIVSGLLAIEVGDLEDTVTVSQAAREADGTRVYLEEGEEVSLLKLVQGLLINSGNDAGIAIAEHIDGSEEKFSERMTEFVHEEIGATDTVFKNPHGLPDPEHVTTAHDMAQITAYAMQNDTFREIVGTREMEWIGESWDTTLRNHHLLVLQREDVTGVKNGYTSDAGFTLSTTAENEEIELVVVTLNAENPRTAYQDTEALIEYGYQYRTDSIPAGEEFTDSEGHTYELEEELFFTIEKDQQWSTDLSTDGLLTILNESEEPIFEYRFPIEEVPTENEPIAGASTDGEVDPNPDESEEDGWLQTTTILSFLLSAILIAAVTYMIYRKRTRASNREHSPIVLESYEEDRRPWKRNW